MSELCPQNCEGNTELVRRHAATSLGRIVKGVTGAKMATYMNAVGHDSVTGYYAYLTVHSSGGEQVVGQSKRWSIQRRLDAAEEAASEQQALVDACEGMCPITAGSGEGARNIEMCGVKLAALIASQTVEKAES